MYLIIGEKLNVAEIGVKADCLKQSIEQSKYIYIDFSEDMVKKAMQDPIYVIQQEGENIPEIKVIPLGNLVARTMVADFYNPDLIAKCAAYLLFHELFHVNTFVAFSQWKDNGSGNTDNEDISHVSKHDIMGFSSEHINVLLGGCTRGDNFRNVVGVSKFGEKRVPGEYELLQALYPEKII